MCHSLIEEAVNQQYDTYSQEKNTNDKTQVKKFIHGYLFNRE